MDKTKKGSKAPRPLSETKGRKQPAATKPKLVSKPPREHSEAEPERLQKVLAEAGVASRRSSEQLILQRRVRVNGNLVTELGTKVDPIHDVITVDNKPLPPRGQEEKVYLALHKPRGYVTTSDDEQGRETVLDLLGDVGARVYPVGRLDNNSEGLLLLTNDGDLTFRLTHPRYKVEKEYEVQTEGVPSEEDLQALRTGIVLDDGVRTQPATVELLHQENGRAWIRFIISEGRKRQIRNMLEAVGQRTRRLIRMRIGPLKLGDLERGQHRKLTPAEVRALRKAVGLDNAAVASTTREVTAAASEPVAPARASRFVRQGGGGESYQRERSTDAPRPPAGGRRAFPSNGQPPAEKGNRSPHAHSARPPARGNSTTGAGSRTTPASARPFPANGNPTTSGHPSRTPQSGNRPSPARGGRPFPSNGNPTPAKGSNPGRQQGDNRPAPGRSARPFPSNGNPTAPAGSRPAPGGNRSAPGGYRPPKGSPPAPSRSGPPQGGSSRPSRPASPSSSRPGRPGGSRPASPGGNRQGPRQGSHAPTGSKPQRGRQGGSKRER